MLISAFVPLNDLINSLAPEVAARWERLWMVSDRRDGVVHPLIYPHPITGLKVNTSAFFTKIIYNEKGVSLVLAIFGPAYEVQCLKLMKRH